MIRRHVVQAIFRRNFFAYFSSPIGYVFIPVFIGVSASLAFWQDVFFTSNIANLGPLNEWFPYLLLFFIPAVAMSIWAEERKQGTDELLFTLPATDGEVVLGKYLSGLGIYSVALLFSLTNVVALKFLGSPDPGVIVGTYLGYWFLGAGMLAIAMVASMLTASQPVAFILGALFCAVPVFLPKAGSISSGRIQDWLVSLGVAGPFSDLASGVVSLRAILYFASIAVVFLYINLLLLARRHTEKDEQWLHFGARTLSLVVIGVALGVITGRLAWSRVDLTEERLHTLTPSTRKVIDRIDPGRPVYIQAYISKDVPESYVEQRETLVQLLKEYDAIGGGRIQLRIVDTERYSPEALQAEEQFDIRAVTVRDSSEGEEDSEGIYLGVAFTCGNESVVIKFFSRGIPVEYELTRSIGTVTGLQRRKIGIATTDAKLFGGLDFQTMSQSPEWDILAELKKQYDVVQVGLDTPITEKMDALLVAQVSSLTQAQMNTLMAYLRQGGPALLFDDPFPQFNPRLAPGEPKSNGRQQPMMGMMPPTPSEPKGDLTKFYADLGMQFPSEGILWDSYNPLPKLPQIPREFLFISKDRFNQSDPITSGLQEMVLMHAGEVRSAGAMPLTFTPLLTTTPVSGSVLKSMLFQTNFFGIQRVEPHYVPRGQSATVAARIKGTVTPPTAPGQNPAPPASLNLIFVADLDCIGNQFFGMRAEAPEGLNFDNVTFVLNCVDVLAGDESYVDLRKRRPKHRTLETFENLTKSHNQKMLDETKEAEEKAEKARSEAQARFDAKLEEVRKRTDFDDRRKEMEVRNLQEVEQKRLTNEQRKIDEEKKAAIERSKTTMKQRVSSIKKSIRNLAVFLAPVPALLMGLYMFARRMAAQGRKS